MRNAATQSTIRINNQELIIEYILENGKTSRANLSKLLNISKPTISSNAEKLIEKNILIELGEGKSSGGRKPTLLDFNYEHKTIIAIDLNRNQPLLALSNLSGEILETVSIEVSVYDDKPILIQKLTTAVNDLVQLCGYKIDSLGAISIAIPGVIDEVTGEIFANPQFNLWTNLNLKQVLNNIYHVPVILKNDISMAALGEKHYGIGKFYDDLVYVSSGLGVGAGIILHGELFEGKRKAAGEIGYSRIDHGSGRKSLEDEISTLTIFKKIKKDIEEGQETLLNKLENKENMTINDIKDALDQGDEYICNYVKEIGSILGIVVMNTALILDLEIIIVGGVLSELGEPLNHAIRAVGENTLPFETIVRSSELKEMAGVYGLLVVAKKCIMKGLVV